MKRHNITSESRLTVCYVLARSKFENSNFTSIEDWVTGLSSLSSSSVVIASASADGTCRMYRKILNKPMIVVSYLNKFIPNIQRLNKLYLMAFNGFNKL